MPMSACISL